MSSILTIVAVIVLTGVVFFAAILLSSIVDSQFRDRWSDRQRNLAESLILMICLNTPCHVAALRGCFSVEVAGLVHVGLAFLYVLFAGLKIQNALETFQACVIVSIFAAVVITAALNANKPHREGVFRPIHLPSSSITREISRTALLCQVAGKCALLYCPPLVLIESAIKVEDFAGANLSSFLSGAKLQISKESCDGSCDTTLIANAPN